MFTLWIFRSATRMTPISYSSCRLETLWPPFILKAPLLSCCCCCIMDPFSGPCRSMKSISSSSLASSLYLNTINACPYPQLATIYSSCLHNWSHSISSIGAISSIPVSMSKSLKLKSWDVVKIQVSDTSKSIISPVCWESIKYCNFISGTETLPI